MELNIDFLIVVIFRIQKSLLIKLLSLNSVALILNLASQLSANILLFLRGNLLAELESSEPILQVHSHLKCKLRLAALKEVVLSHIMLEED